MVAIAPPEIKLLPHQFAFVHSDAPWLITDGGRGSGKTDAIAVKVAMRARKPGAREGLYRQKLVDLRTSTLRSMLEGNGSAQPILIPGSYTHNQQMKTIKIHGGGEIVYNGMDQGDVGRQSGSTGRGSSMNLSGAAFDEWVEMRETAVVQVAMAVRLKVDGLPLQRYGACNPSVPMHWLAQRFGMSPGGQSWKGHARIMAPAWSNWHLPPEYLDELRALHGVARERYWLGKWVGSDGMVYDKWDREKHVADSSWPAKRKVYGVDEGYKDPFTVVEVEVDTDGRLRVTREVYQSQLTQAEKIRMVKDMAGESEVIVDSSAPDLIESMRREGVDAKACQKGAGSVNFGIGLIQQRLVVLGDGLPRLTVDPSCTNTIREFETYEWKPGGDRLKDEPYDKDNHAMDALRYAVRHLDDGDACYGYAAPVRRQDRRGVWQ